jgi:alkylhydroperoxidase/carboxymuconolactone decarboxylase family protein YurZ
METTKTRTGAQGLQGKNEVLIALGAATAVNCIPCFEHLYENAINSGITKTEIKRASEIAGQVKKGAHIALTNIINELIGIESRHDLPCGGTANKPCCG